jgi:hypothetical protein
VSVCLWRILFVFVMRLEVFLRMMSEIEVRNWRDMEEGRLSCLPCGSVERAIALCVVATLDGVLCD